MKIYLLTVHLALFCLQLYMAPITHPDRYNDSIEFWRNVYGIDSEYDAELDF